VGSHELRDAELWLEFEDVPCRFPSFGEAAVRGQRCRINDVRTREFSITALVAAAAAAAKLPAAQYAIANGDGG
jgi:hypothetical protein